MTTKRYSDAMLAPNHRTLETQALLTEAVAIMTFAENGDAYDPKKIAAFMGTVIKVILSHEGEIRDLRKLLDRVIGR